MLRDVEYILKYNNFNYKINYILENGGFGLTIIREKNDLSAHISRYARNKIVVTVFNHLNTTRIVSDFYSLITSINSL